MIDIEELAFEEPVENWILDDKCIGSDNERKIERTITEVIKSVIMEQIISNLTVDLDVVNGFIYVCLDDRHLGRVRLEDLLEEDSDAINNTIEDEAMKTRAVQSLSELRDNLDTMIKKVEKLTFRKK